MHLLVPDLPHTVPASRAVDSKPAALAIDVRLPVNDPRGLPLVPGMRVTLVEDDGRELGIVLGDGWTSHAKGSVMRIPYARAKVPLRQPKRASQAV